MAKTTYLIPWFRLADWPRWRELYPGLQETHQQWVQATEQTLAGRGLRPNQIRKIEIDPDEFTTWCRANGHSLAARSRALYVEAIDIAQDEATANKKPRH